MPKGDKYSGLTTYFEKCDEEKIKMSFLEIERILGFKLADSAYLHSAFWANTESHSIAFGWLDAGYKTQNVNIKAQTVEFIKVKRN
ncbi:MAG: hypothetical protein MR303_02445 [Emergencia sp.]|nr:hypothetical protein [Emergencia sp.]